MSRLVALLLVLALAARPAGAQNVQRLERMWREAARASARVDSLARLRVLRSVDTVRAENLVILAPFALDAVARDVAPSVLAELTRTYGDEIRTPHHRVLRVAFYVADGGPPPYGFPQDATPIPVASTSPNTTIVIGQTLIAIDDQLRKDFDRPLERWLSQGIRTNPSDRASPDLYEDLVTSLSVLARSCYVGSLSACGSALGVIPLRDVAREAYDAAGRRALVAAIPGRGYGPVQNCVQGGQDQDCLRVLEGPDSFFVPPPLFLPSREFLARTALQLGGPQAFHRLLASAGRPLANRLELASGMSLDSLLGRWRASVLASRPASVDLTPAIGWVAFAWALTLGGFVLRSTRWRT